MLTSQVCLLVAGQLLFFITSLNGQPPPMNESPPQMPPELSSSQTADPLFDPPMMQPGVEPQQQPQPSGLPPQTPDPFSDSPMPLTPGPPIPTIDESATTTTDSTTTATKTTTTETKTTKTTTATRNATSTTRPSSTGKSTTKPSSSTTRAVNKTTAKTNATTKSNSTVSKSTSSNAKASTKKTTTSPKAGITTKSNATSTPAASKGSTTSKRSTTTGKTTTWSGKSTTPGQMPSGNFGPPPPGPMPGPLGGDSWQKPTWGNSTPPPYMKGVPPPRDDMGGMSMPEGWHIQQVDANLLENLDQFAGENGYDSSQYPTFEDGEQTTVNVSVYISNLGSLSEATSSYDAEVYLTVSWQEPRLDIPEGILIQASDATLHKKVWRPTVFFSNSRSASKPDVIMSNEILFVCGWGNHSVVIYQTRVMLSTACPMEFYNFPFDNQTCPLEMAVFGYTSDQVELKWGVPSLLADDAEKADPNPVTFNSRIKLTQFTMTNFSHQTLTSSTEWNAYCTPHRRCLQIKMSLSRMFSFYMVDSFVPSTLILMLSWLSFWVDADAVPARVTLCVTTFLTLQATSTNVRSRLPAVSYMKAIDIWLTVCQTEIFLALLEFIMIHFVARKWVNWKMSHRRPIPPRFRVGDYDEKLQAMAAEEMQRQHTQMVKEHARTIGIAIDNWARYLFPLAFIGFAIFFFVHYIPH